VKAAGIDVSKHKLDVAVHGSTERLSVPNDAQGHRLIAEHLAGLGIERVGMEASGHYEAALGIALRQAGFMVVVLEPGQVHGYRRFTKKRAKTDPIDATLIAAVTAALEEVRAAPDPRIAPMAEHLTLIEQIVEDIARLKTRLDRFTDKTLLRHWDSEITRLTKTRDKERAKLLDKVRTQPDLKRRLELLLSIPGLGEVGALAIVLRMPELGHMSREQAASLLGVAPFNGDSGDQTSARRIFGGRARLRKTLYLSAFSACHHWNADLKTLYQRLIAKGKHAKIAVIACVRKLIGIANAVLARGTPWVPKTLAP
jgi:transposase